MMIGKIERLQLRDIWKHEALDFTRWMEENVDVLNDSLDLSLVNVERERSVGDFSVDLVAEDENGNVAIIENQLGKSDHDHLGKLLTYLSALEAKVAIWIVSEPRPEHVRTIAWLNESTNASFYMLKIEAIRIGDSEPAPLLTKIVGPSEEGREVGETKKEMSARHAFRLKFWQQLLERAKAKTKLHNGISASSNSWIGTGMGITGLALNYAIRQHDAQVELYIDRGKETEEENKLIFDQILAHKDEIESVFGGALEWERLDSRRACRICKRLELGGYRDEEDKWPEIQDAMIDAMVRLEKSLRPYIKELKLI